MARLTSIPGTTSVLNVLPVVQALEALGYDTAPILERAQIQRDALEVRHARLPASLEFAFWDAICEHTNDPLIALRVAEHVPTGALGGYEYLMRSSQTLRSAIALANRFERVMDDYSRISIIEEEGEAQARLRVWREGGIPHPARGTECLFAAVVRVAREVLPSQGPPLEVRFSHQAPGAVRAFEEAFGCAVRFGQPHDEIVLPRGVFDAPQSTADPGLSQVLEEHMAHVLETLPKGEPFLHQARTTLGEALQHGEVSLEQLARAMHLSPRTLRRRLEEHGTGYKTLLDDLRRDLACHYVARTEASFDDIAQRLAFADSRALYRAFRRWTGTTPAAYRKASAPAL